MQHVGNHLSTVPSPSRRRKREVQLLPTCATCDGVMEVSFLYTFKKWNEKLTILIEKYHKGGGIDWFFTDDDAKDLFQNFECIFGYTSVPATTFCLNSALLQAGDKSPSDVFPPGALYSLHFLHSPE